MSFDYKQIRVRKNLPAWEIPYLLKWGMSSVIDGVVTISTLGYVNTPFGLNAARDLASARIKRLQK